MKGKTPPKFIIELLLMLASVSTLEDLIRQVQDDCDEILKKRDENLAIKLEMSVPLLSIRIRMDKGESMDDIRKSYAAPVKAMEDLILSEDNKEVIKKSESLEVSPDGIKVKPEAPDPRLE